MRIGWKQPGRKDSACEAASVSLFRAISGRHCGFPGAPRCRHALCHHGHYVTCIDRNGSSQYTVTGILEPERWHLVAILGTATEARSHLSMTRRFSIKCGRADADRNRVLLSIRRAIPAAYASAASFRPSAGAGWRWPAHCSWIRIPPQGFALACAVDSGGGRICRAGGDFHLRWQRQRHDAGTILTLSRRSGNLLVRRFLETRRQRRSLSTVP